jgi:biopolymer transport protein ExbD
MRFHRGQREIPELNTTSTADISFMLLVFFLVTSSMDTDHGLGRQLAPMDDQRQEQRDVNRSNVLQISIDDNDILTCDGQQVTLDKLREQVESFLASRQTENYTIAVETGRHTSYNAYFEMQNSIVAAYRKLDIKPMKIMEGILTPTPLPEARGVKSEELGVKN